jgi:hypothetical protein
MMEAKHTPGPWFITDGDEWTDGIHTETPEQGIWSVAYANKRRHEFVANKRLIAAAPELLAALTSLLAMCERQSDFNDDGDGRMFDRARAAIAKAIGAPCQ